MTACERCGSTHTIPFSPERHIATLGAVLLCQRCQHITIALPSSRRQALAKQSAALSHAA